MKDKDFALAIHDLFKKIDKIYHKTIRHFEADVIHEFRVDIKKLRGLLGLVGYHFNNVITIGLTKKIKTFYGYVGIVRNLQLQQEIIQSYCHKMELPIPGDYLEELKKEEIYWKKQALDYMNDQNNFWDDEEEIIKNLPPQVNENARQNYLLDKMFELKTILPRIAKDDQLHAARKLIKNLQYDWKFIPTHLLSAPLASKENIEEITNVLGQFRDKCIAINHLQEAMLRNITNEEEKEVLHKIANALKAEKVLLKKQAIHWLQQINININAPALSLHSPLSL